MGNVTAKTSGDIASFMSPSMTNIKSLKVHFSPKQLGTGDPSPENVREIEGWDGVEGYGSGKNIAHIVGYSAVNSDSNNSRSISNKYGTTINTTEFSLPDTKLIITQTEHPNTTYLADYANGYIGILVDNLVWGQKYNVSFKVEDIISNPLNASEQNIKLFVPSGGSSYSVKKIQDNRVLFKNVLWQPHPNTNVNRRNFEIRICGMSFTLSEFMVTPADEDDFEFEPYQGDIYSKEWTKNLLDIWERPNGYTPSQNVNGNSAWSKEWFVTDELKGKTITYSTFIDNTNVSSKGYVHIWTKNSEGNFIKTSIIPPSNKQIVGGESGWSYVNLILTDDIYSVVFGITISANATAKYPMVELGSEPTEYQPYVGTVYGGYVDLISGELVEEYGYVKLEDLNWTVKNNNRIITDDLSSSILSPSYSVTVNIIGEQVQPAKYSMDLTKYPNAIACSSNGQLIKYYDGENPQGLMVYQLETPITHQLTPTQLSSFIGQNNFWSNADYVEIEYELKETEDIQKCRKKIILNQPQLKTISDKVVSFNTDMVAPLKNCKIYFKPIQLGTGDPSPTNVRNINGWTELDSYVNGNKVSVDWTNDIGTIYGGYLDLAKKEVVAEWEIAQGKWGDIKSSTPNSITGYYYGRLNYNNAIQVCHSQSNYFVDSICNITNTILWNTGEKTPKHYYSGNDSNGKGIVYIYGNFNDNVIIQVASRLLEPIHYPLSSLTPQQLLTLKSTNHIWSETNGQQIDVKYWTHKNLIPTPLTNYLENQTWIDSAYISSSGKKTTNTVSASHFLTNQILLEAGTYVLSGFSYYVGTDSTRYRIHAYDSTGKWLRQITFQQIDNLSPVDISFTLDTDTYVNVSIAMDFDGVLAKIS